MTAVVTCGAATQDRVGSATTPPERGWWRRWWRPAPPPKKEERPVDLDQLLGVLETAREQLAAGWVQYGWWAVRRGSRQVLEAGLHDNPGPVEGVCLVGAIVLAGRYETAARDEIGAAVDAVYEALWQPGAQEANAPVGVSTPRARLARVRELTRWNDRPERTQQEVLAALDRAIAATIMRLVAVPGPSAPDRAVAAASR